ncbi:osteopontin [Neoarius graeffei]|uniref:osteopontin n=1 Tax=Neoarius graeffei TaxID=443677 RepID=UPI00298D169B|nr:osteopontin [Neoarius graeffei]
MKAVIVFMLLFAAVYCHPVKRSTSSSESTEMQSVDGQSDSVPDESSEEEDIDDDADDDDSDSDESDEITDPTAFPITESTLIPTINGRGDNIGYQSNYKKHIYYVDGNNVEKGPSSFKARSFNKGNYKDEDLKLLKVLDKSGLDQGVEVSSGTESDDISQLEQRSAISASDASDGDSSASQESEENSQSSEEDTTAANTTANDSSESSESEEINVTDQPVVIKNSNPEVVNL